MLNPRTAKHTFMFIALAFIIAALSLLSLSVGGVSVPLKEVLASLAGRNAEASDLIIMQFRLPRITAAILIGAALAVAGALLQGVIRNPLASPDLLGVTGGASVAVVAFMTFVISYSIHWIPFIAIGGALIAAIINYVFAWKKGVSPFRLVLIGIGISTAMGALTTFLLISGPAYLAAQVLNWMTGSIYGTNWSYIKVLWPWVAIFIPLSLGLAKELNVQSLGEDVARGLGSRLQLSRMILLFYSVALMRRCGRCSGDDIVHRIDGAAYL